MGNVRAIPFGICFVGAALNLAGCGGDSGSSGGVCGIDGCGGDIKGTWDVTGICEKITGVAANTGIAACDSVAKDAIATAKVVPVNMTVTVTDTTMSIMGDLEGKFHYVYTNACLTAQGSSGASTEQCAAIQTSLMGAGQPGTCALVGDTCECDATQSLPGLNQQETYTVEGTTLVSGSDRNPYCVKGDTAQVSATQNGISVSFTLKRH